MIVPGNHDNLSFAPERKMEDLKEYYINKKLETYFYNELSQLSNFYIFADRNRCFHKSKIIDVRTITIGCLNIKFNLINSAPFSLLGSDNGDKGMHYLPEREIEKLDWTGKEDYTISIIHHGQNGLMIKRKRLFMKNYILLLFLSYVASNVQILNPIMESLIKHMDAWDELDIDKKNVEYLTKPMKPIKTGIPDKKEKKKHEEEKTVIEKEIIEKRQKESDIESLYSYDENKVNSFGNKISKSINYLELVAKILPNFCHILNGKQKQDITNILYTYPNKLLYFMLKDIDLNCDKIMEEIMSQHPKTKKGLLITKDMLMKSLQNQSLAYILGILYLIIVSLNVEILDLKMWCEDEVLGMAFIC